MGRRRRQLGGDRARGGRRAPRRAAHRRRQHDRRHRPDRRRARRRDRAQRPGAAAGRRARLHRRAAHQPRGDRAARAGPRPVVSGLVRVLRHQRRHASRARPSGAGGVRLPHARTAVPRPSPSRASASRGWCAPTSSSSARATSTRSRRSCTASSFVRSRTRRAARQLPPGAPVVAVGSGAFLGREVAARLERTVADAPVGRDGQRGGARRGAGRAAGGAVLTVVKVGGGLGRRRAAGHCATRSASSAGAIRCSSCPAARASRTPCAKPTAASDCARRPRTAWRSSAWSSSAGCSASSSRAPSGAPTSRAYGAGRTTVLLPAALPLDALPASWEVTSDSIAAWVAGQVGAGRLVLVKGVDGLFADWPPRGDPLTHLTVAELAALRHRRRRRVPARGARGRALRDMGDRRA